MILKALKYIKRRIVPFPYVYGGEFTKLYDFLMESQWWPKKKLEEFQNEKLQIIIRYAYNNVPYYKKIFNVRGLKPSDIKTSKDLKLLPILTKDEIRKNFNKLLAKNYRKYYPILSHTSGSTGTAMDFYLTKNLENVIESAHVWRHWNWANYNYSNRCVVIRGKIITEDLNVIAPYKMDQNTLLLSSFHLSPKSIKQYVELMKKFKPKIIRAYPSAMLVITKFLKRASIKPVEIESIITSSETLLPTHRKEIEEFWGAKIYDWYGLGERAAAIGECEKGGFHINSEYGIIEFKDIPKNNHKEIIATSFWNFAMPFIRYSTKDIVMTLTNNQCPCGRTLPIVKSIDGRIEDFIITKDLRFIGRLDAALKYSRGIKFTQIVQDKIGHILVKIVKDAEFTSRDHEKLNLELKKRLGNNIDIDYEFTNDIPRNKAGKLRFVISKIKLNNIL